MPKRDIKQINAIARQYHMTKIERLEFGKFIEELKSEGFRGSDNERGDFTYQELHQKVQEFFEETR